MVPAPPSPSGDFVGFLLRSPSAARPLLAVLLALIAFGLFLLTTGRDPAAAAMEAFQGTLGSGLGWSEIGVLMAPLVLAALAGVIPARVGLINVGGEGQLLIGAWAATGVALALGLGHGWSMLGLMAAAGSAAGGLWAGAAVLLRQLRRANEVITTLLSNYLAVLVVNVFVFGPWKNPHGLGYPYTADFEAAAIIGNIGGTRFHWGFVVPMLAVAVCYVVLTRTKWGFRMRAVGGNPEASLRTGLPVGLYLVYAMIVGGGLAGLAGMIEVSAVHHHLRPGIAHNLGYLGFLASWLAGHNPLAAVVACFLLAVFLVGGNVLQISSGLPSAAAFILIGLVLFFVLGLRQRDRSNS